MEWLKQCGKAVVVAFLVFHLMATLVNLIPEKSWLRRAIQPLFWHYQCASGLQQRWDMFDVIANHRTSQVELVVHRAGDGGEITVGAMLPELKPFDFRRTFRHHTMMGRTWFFESPKFLEALGPKYRQALERIGPTPLGDVRSLELKFDYEQINPLVFMRAGGDPGFPHSLRRELWTAE